MPLHDYVFITCSGHGEHQVGKQLNETVLYLNEDETIKISEINPKNKRHTIVVDACRSLVQVKEAKINKAAMESASDMMESVSRVDHRAIFDTAVMATSEGRIEVYSCGINQTAGDPGTGGIFTQSLLRTPSYVSTFGSSSYKVLTIEQAAEMAKNETYEINAPQLAEMNAGRRRDFYPFAIVAS